jgi:predicted site-specific integrase-resolvase
MLTRMNTENARVTRKEAAVLAGVSERTINRWSARGLVRVWRDPDFRLPATYDRAQIMAVAAGARRVVTLELPETDIST